ncbi:hypothetical protein, partial [uncultured Victivallis sp.]|uniref:hypothetical protein n=1 Tax=uncultured Victivallis sp. TaxID=354118 RepID=UPI0025D276EF
RDLRQWLDQPFTKPPEPESFQPEFASAIFCNFCDVSMNKGGKLSSNHEKRSVWQDCNSA